MVTNQELIELGRQMERGYLAIIEERDREIARLEKVLAFKEKVLRLVVRVLEGG